MSDSQSNPAEPFLVIDASFDYPQNPVLRDALMNARPNEGSTPHVESAPTFSLSIGAHDIQPLLGTEASEISARQRRIGVKLLQISRLTADLARDVESIADYYDSLARTRGALPLSPASISSNPLSANISRNPAQGFPSMSDTKSYEGIAVTEEQAARVWHKVLRTSDHWVWTGMRHKKSGRPMVRIGTKMAYAQRVVYTLHTGQDLGGQYLKLNCEESACVRPDHHRRGALGGTPLREPTDPYGLIDADPKMLLDDRGKPKLCKRGHTKTWQPNGRSSCRVCDRIRHGSHNATDLIQARIDRANKRTLEEELDFLSDDLMYPTLPSNIATSPILSPDARARLTPALQDDHAATLMSPDDDDDDDIDALIAEHFVPEPEPIDPIDPMSRLRARGMTVVPAPE